MIKKIEDNDTSDLRGLRRQVVDLRQLVAVEGGHLFRRWRSHIRCPSFVASALNLAHYRELWHHDLRSLQRSLMRYGLSSVGRLESRVLASLDAVSAALQRMTTDAPETPCRFPTERQFFRGETRLRANALELFGPAAKGRETRILATLSSEAANNPGLVLDLARRGTDAVRINCAHDDEIAWSSMICYLPQAEQATGRRIRILVDIAGSKCRTDQVWTDADRRTLVAGDRLLLCRTPGDTDGRFPFSVAFCAFPAVEQPAVFSCANAMHLPAKFSRLW